MVFDRYRDPDVMSLRDVPVPEPQEGEVLIRVAYAGVNAADSKARSGHSARAGYRYQRIDFPFVTGNDAAGVVQRTGSGVTEFSPGDPVITWGSLDLDAVGPATLPQALDTLRPGGRLINILTVTADGDIERDRKEAERRGFRKITTIINFDRARESMREITHLIDAGLVHVPPIDVLPLEDAALAHQMIDTGHVRGKLVLKVGELSA